jgi:hypothetical protein
LFVEGNFIGRIPPYLLKPVPNATSTSGMFSGCPDIVAYITASSNGEYVTIPKSFFSYAQNITSLSGMFRYDSFYGNIVDVFDKLKKSLDVSYIFADCT